MTELTVHPKVVIVEDHDALRESFVEFLVALGYSVFGASCGEELDEYLSEHDCSILILDVGLPGESGFEIAERIRAAHPEMYIVMLTALTDEAHKIQGYSFAEVYLPKPVSGQELVAVVNALRRRIAQENRLHRPVSLDLFHSEVSCEAGCVALNLQEKALLKTLAEAKDGRVPAWRLMEVLDQIQGEEIDKPYLEMQIFRLRKKLNEIVAPRPMIKTERGLGYRLLHQIVLKDK